MKCVIPSQNVKIVARAVHSLARVGDEIFIQPSEDGVVFRTINSAKSAFAEFRMCRSFFSSFNFSPAHENDTACKITMKSCLNVFKSSHGMDKQVENCEVRIKPDTTQVIFQIKFTNSSVKKYYLPIIENDLLEAQIPTDAPNNICASSKFLSASLKNFRYSEDEITIDVKKDKTIIKNHLELKRDQQLMRTELCYQQAEFENYVVDNPTEVTFCLKELRAVVMFAEPGNLPVYISFSEPGRPIVFQVLNHPAYEANYVVSTLQSSLHNISNRSTSSQVSESSLTTPTPNTIKIASNTSTPYSFREDKTSSSPIFPKRRRTNEESFFPDIGPIPSTSYQANIEKSVQKLITRPVQSTTNSLEPILLGVEPRASTSFASSPQPGPSHVDLPFFSDLPSTSIVVPESEPSSLSLGTPTENTCRLDTVIKGVHASSQPSEELLKTVFSRCFSKDHFMSRLMGHDVVLEENSDKESS